MKLTIIILSFLLTGIIGYSQDYNKNNCTNKCEIVFLSKSSAIKFSESHTAVNKYLNIVINDSAILYDNDELNDESDLFQAINKSEELPEEFNVVIGIKNSVPFKKFTDFVCWLKELGTDKIKAIRVYHFD